MNKQVIIPVLLTVMLIQCYCFSFSQSEQYHFKNLSAQDGFTSATVWSILKDSRGFMWFGASDGLYRYDGYTFKLYRTDADDTTTLSENLIYRLFEDDKDRLWIGTLSKGLNRFNRETESFIRYDTQIDTIGDRRNQITSIYQDRFGEIWVSSKTGYYYKYIDSTDKLIPYKFIPDSIFDGNNHIYNFCEDRSGRFWACAEMGFYMYNFDTESFYSPDFISSINGKYVYYENNRWMPFDENLVEWEDPWKYPYVNIFEDTDGTLWFGSRGGLLKIDTNNILTEYGRNLNNKHSLSNPTIRDIILNPLDGGQTFWISTYIGLNHFNKLTNRTEQFLNDPSNPNSLGFNSLYGLFLDDCGILWIGTENNGVELLNLSVHYFEDYTIGPGQEDDNRHSATSFLEDREGNIWIGTFQGGLFKYNKNMDLIDRYYFDLGYRDCPICNFIYTVYEDPDGYVWAGTMTNNLFLYDSDNNTFRHCQLIDGDENIKYQCIREIFKDSFGWYWIATNTGLFIQKSGQSPDTVFYKINFAPLNKLRIRDFCEDRNGTIWVTTQNAGIYTLAKGDRNTEMFTKFPSESVVSTNMNITCALAIHKDNEGDLWFGTDQGLYEYSLQNKTLKNYNPENGLVEIFIKDIQGDDKGNLWLATDGGLIRFSTREEIL